MNNELCIPQNRMFITEIIIQNGDEYYTLKDGEKLVFGMKKNPLNTAYILKKEITVDDKHVNGYLLTLRTEETDIPQGAYWYDIALVRSDHEMIKIIGSTRMEIVESVVRSD